MYTLECTHLIISCPHTDHAVSHVNYIPKSEVDTRTVSIMILLVGSSEPNKKLYSY